MTIEEKNRFDRMEQHIDRIQKDISNILNALVGNEINGNKGLIHKVHFLEEEQEKQYLEIVKLKDQNIKNETLISTLKWVLGGIIGSILAYVIITIISK